MEKTSLNKALALFIAAQVLAIGCGDGGKRRRQPITRSGSMQKAFAQNQGNAQFSDQKQTPGSSALSNPKDLKAKSEKMNKMKTELAQRSAGAGITAQQVEEGLYALEEISSHLVYQDSATGDDVEMLNIYSSNALQLNKVGGESVGLISNFADMGRQIVIPYKFFVKGLQGQPWQPKRDQSVSEVLFVTGAEMKPGSSSLVDAFRSGAEAVDEVTVIKALATQAGSIDNEVAYEATDHAGKKVHIRLRKGNEGKLRMVITVLEEGATAVDSKKVDGRYLKRTIVLVYGKEGQSQEKRDVKTEAMKPQAPIEQPPASIISAPPAPPETQP